MWLDRQVPAYEQAHIAQPCSLLLQRLLLCPRIMVADASLATRWAGKQADREVSSSDDECPSTLRGSEPISLPHARTQSSQSFTLCGAVKCCEVDV